MRGGGCKYAYDPTSVSAPRSRFGRWVDRRLKSLASLFEWTAANFWVAFPVAVLISTPLVFVITKNILRSAMDTDHPYTESERIASRVRSFEREGHRFLYVNSFGKFGMLHDPDCPCGKR